MSDYTIVDTATGRLEAKLICAAHLAQLQLLDMLEITDAETGTDLGTAEMVRNPNHILIDGHHDGRTLMWRVVPSIGAWELVDRPRLDLPEQVTIAADGSDAVACTGVPIDTIIRVFGEGGEAYGFEHSEQAGDPEFSFSTAARGTFRVIIEPPWPWQRQEVVVTAE